MSIPKRVRQIVFEKYNNRCAYCGKKLTYEKMQADHIIPKRNGGTDSVENLNPSCSSCNHYKRTQSVETYRNTIRTIHKRIRQDYLCKVAEDYGIIKVNKWDEKFYFEKFPERETAGD